MNAEMAPSSVPVEEIRAEIARKMIPIYQLAASARLHPNHLGAVLRGRRPLTEEMGKRLLRALAETSQRDLDDHAA